MNCIKWYKLHQWTKWTTTDEGELTCNGKSVGKWFIQVRTCLICGREQRKMNEVQ